MKRWFYGAYSVDGALLSNALNVQTGSVAKHQRHFNICRQQKLYQRTSFTSIDSRDTRTLTFPVRHRRRLRHNQTTRCRPPAHASLQPLPVGSNNTMCDVTNIVGVRLLQQFRTKQQVLNDNSAITSKYWFQTGLRFSLIVFVLNSREPTAIKQCRKAYNIRCSQSSDNVQ